MKRMNGTYVTQENFDSICHNTSELINVLNHRMTKLEADVCWIKKIMSIQTGLITGIFIAIMGLVMKIIFA